VADPAGEIRWTAVRDPARWDELLAAVGGHPLQSALWGQAKALEGVDSACWLASLGERPVFMARVEARRKPLVGDIAWIPKGPAVLDTPRAADLTSRFLTRLAADGFSLCVAAPYLLHPGLVEDQAASRLEPPTRTVLVDLERGRDPVFAGMHGEWRYAVRAAQRAGVVIEQSVEPADLEAFYDLCRSVSERKSFELPGSPGLMRALLVPSVPTAAQARLFVARLGAKVIAGALVMRVGTALHYMWGATDRAHAKVRAGESLQWAVMSWAIDAGCKRYDMEGIDPQTNPGGDAFKRRSGGAEAALPGTLAYPLSARGRAAAFAGPAFVRFRALLR
jgi:hypothetical protein